MFSFFKRKGLNFTSDFKSEPNLQERELCDPPEYLISTPSSMPVTRDINASENNQLDNIDIEQLQDKCDLANKEVKEELETHIGKLVICISNQIENPTIALGVEVINNEHDYQYKLFGYDIVRKEQVELSGIIFDYTEQKFDALNQMDSDARIALFFNRLGNNVVSKNKASGVELFTSLKWKEKVSEAIERINRGEWT